MNVHPYNVAHQIVNFGLEHHKLCFLSYEFDYCWERSIRYWTLEGSVMSTDEVIGFVMAHVLMSDYITVTN